ncbi:hypothetical protein PTKIN_Ptkin07bG0287900 [Pterospermum kingtungense]
MMKKTSISQYSLFIVFCIFVSFLSVEAYNSHRYASAVGHYLVKKHERKTLTVTEYGEISAAKLSDGTRGPYHLQFITLEPNSLFLPVLLHADMVFYVHTGGGTLFWTDDDKIRKVNIRKGDVYRLHQGSIFYVQSSLEPERVKLRIHAIFSNTEDNKYESMTGAYSSIRDVFLGFDSKVLQAAFKAPDGVIEEIMTATKPEAIIHAVEKEEKKIGEWQARLLKAFLGSNGDGFDSFNGNKKKKTKAYNVLEADPDFENCNGWSITVDKHNLPSLKDSNFGVFMVNLTKGSMMAPHWNPRASEITIVLQGQGMIRVTCSTSYKESECKSLRFRVKEGDMFAVPRFHPMAQMSFNNDSFVFMGFSTSTRRNYPQFLAGKRSVIGVLDRQILAMSFNVTNRTIDQLLTPQKEAVILECTSCAEEEERVMEEEIERERQEEEERRKREEKEARKKEEEEEAKKREEEEAKKREEEEARSEEEEAKKREEEKKRREEEARKEEEEEEARRQEEERQKRAREEEKKRREEEEARKEQEEARRQEEERQKRAREEKKKREEEEEEEEARKEQEEARRQEEERERRAREEEERRQQEEKEKERRRKEEEQEEPRRREEEKEQHEERRRQEEAAAREQEEARRQEQERQKRAEQEAEEARREREPEGGDEGWRVLKTV